MSKADTTDMSPAESSLNRAAAARRRLIRAVGAGGGAAISTLVASGWKKPVLQLAVLPVHAQLTGPCTVGAEINITVSGPNAFTMLLGVTRLGGGGSTLLDFATGTGGTDSTANVSGTQTISLGSYQMTMSISQAASQPVAIDFTESCCGLSFRNQTGAIQANIFFLFAQIDDGHCTLL